MKSGKQAAIDKNADHYTLGRQLMQESQISQWVTEPQKWIFHEIVTFFDNILYFSQIKL